MKIDTQQLEMALEAIEASKGISRETVFEALTDAMTRAYRKQLGGDDAYVKVNLDLEKGELSMCHVLMVVKDVEDDFLEISVEDANAQAKKGKKYSVGDEFEIEAPIDTMRNATLMSIKSIMKQKFAEAERGILYEAFKDKINTMITGRVEAIDERGASINIGRTSVFLPRKEMIGDEHFTNGENIKLFVNDVASGTKGAHIEVSRACEGFLKSLFMEEIPDVYNGNIIIKAIARQAGERSKVAVWALDPNVDPAGACIGPNGSRVQKIVGQLGNGSNKEKVDVIQYFDNPLIFIAEALKPARIAGIKVDEEGKTAIAVVKDDSLSLAIGKKGVNARLAVKLTGYKIDIKVESDALAEGFEFTSYDELQSIATSLKAQRISDAQKIAVTNAPSLGEVLPGLPDGYVAPQQRVYEEEKNDFDEVLEEKSESEEIDVSAKEVSEEPVVQKEIPAPAPVEEVVTTTVKTTTSLSDLEASLEAEKNKAKDKENRKNFSKKRKDEEEEKEEAVVTTEPVEKMSIYTEEELKQFEEEDKADEDYEDEEEVDYDEYDDYYDDNK